MESAPIHSPKSRSAWLEDWPLFLIVLTLTLALLGHTQIADTHDNPFLLTALILVIGVVCLNAAVAIVKHAELVAHRLGEPLGTLLLTLAITGLEVAIVAFVMSSGEPVRGRGDAGPTIDFDLRTRTPKLRPWILGIALIVAPSPPLARGGR